MTDDAHPPETKLTTTKRRWAADGKFLTGRIVRPEDERLPPGQHLVKDWPVLDLGQQPIIRTESWRLDITGHVEHPLSLDWAAFKALPQSDRLSDMHCVTTWSRYDNRWSGVLARDFLKLVKPHADAKHIVFQSYDGYATNVTMEMFSAPDVLLAHSWEGSPLTREHGGPVRIVMPQFYFWKSAKWVKHIAFLDQDAPGYWEVRGYHNVGDPWKEERYG